MPDQTPEGEVLLEERTLEEWLDLADSTHEDALSVRRENVSEINALMAESREKEAAALELEAQVTAAFDHHRGIRLSVAEAARKVLADDEKSNEERFFAWGLLASDSRDRAQELADLLSGVDAYVQANPGAIFVRKDRFISGHLPQGYVIGKLTGAPLELSYKDHSWGLDVELSAGALEFSTEIGMGEKVKVTESDEAYNISVSQIIKSASGDPEDQGRIDLLVSNYSEEHQTQIFENVEELLRQLKLEIDESKLSTYEYLGEAIVRGMFSVGLITRNQVSAEMLEKWTSNAEKMLGEIFLKLRFIGNTIDEKTLVAANYITSSKDLVANYRQAVLTAMSTAMAVEFKNIPRPYPPHLIEQTAGLYYNVATNLLGIDDLSRETWFEEVVPKLVEQ